MGSLLVSGARDNTMRVWDMDLDMMCRRAVTGHKDDVAALAAVNLLAPCVTGRRSNMGEDAAQGEPAPTVLPVTVFASASADGTLRLWSRNWTCLSVLALPMAKAPRPAPALAANGHLHHGSSGALAGAANGSPTGAGAPAAPDSHKPLVPPALCCALTRSAVMAGFGDGELRVWHCGDEFRAAALQIASM
eukprot:CAMPEP_0202881342 /NCGR_PEP_ID=MMETSP1391-20130828/36395_1 /ASSEMBLY_ACC=CAM_ASM_000867 /TAXON_ID=1034604 /ORGANISM="Chlamydomonas leiostraca, Strain SAG 11-49" /LENGTH=190 /DNA_ID=CAMNT_0049564013 /DNA_START=32 /DNA_END=601 /DNA_ORIENTATION=-